MGVDGKEVGLGVAQAVGDGGVGTQVLVTGTQAQGREGRLGTQRDVRCEELSESFFFI